MKNVALGSLCNFKQNEKIATGISWLNDELLADEDFHCGIRAEISQMTIEFPFFLKLMIVREEDSVNA